MHLILYSYFHRDYTEISASFMVKHLHFLCSFPAPIIFVSRRISYVFAVSKLFPYFSLPNSITPLGWQIGRDSLEIQQVSYPMHSHTETTKPHAWKHLLPFNHKCRGCSTASGNILLQ